MMRRKIALIAVVGLLVLSFCGEARADRPWHRGGPGPKPVEWGDPDWPAFSKDFRVDSRLAGEDAGETSQATWIEVWRTKSRPICHIQGQNRVQSRCYVVRILGFTIVIRR